MVLGLELHVCLIVAVGKSRPDQRGLQSSNCPPQIASPAYVHFELYFVYCQNPNCYGSIWINSTHSIEKTRPRAGSGLIESDEMRNGALQLLPRLYQSIFQMTAESPASPSLSFPPCDGGIVLGLEVIVSILLPGYSMKAPVGCLHLV